MQLFQAERPLAVFLHQKLKALLVNIMACLFAQSNGERVVNKKIMRIDLLNHGNILCDESINVDFVARKVFRKLLVFQTQECHT